MESDDGHGVLNVRCGCVNRVELANTGAGVIVVQLRIMPRLNGKRKIVSSCEDGSVSILNPENGGVLSAEGLVYLQTVCAMDSESVEGKLAVHLAASKRLSCQQLVRKAASSCNTVASNPLFPSIAKAKLCEKLGLDSGRARWRLGRDFSPAPSAQVQLLSLSSRQHDGCPEVADRADSA